MKGWQTEELTNTKPTFDFLMLLVESGAFGSAEYFNTASGDSRILEFRITVSVPEPVYSACQDTALNRMIRDYKEKNKNGGDGNGI